MDSIAGAKILRERLGSKPAIREEPSDYVDASPLAAWCGIGGATSRAHPPARPISGQRHVDGDENRALRSSPRPNSRKWWLGV